MGNTQATLEDPDPFKLEDTTELPPEVFQLWKEVVKHVRNDGTPVPLERSKSALEYVKEYLGTHEQAQQFVEHYMGGIVEEILSRESPEEQSDESRRIEGFLKLSTEVVVKNMDLQLKENGSLETAFTILTNLFCEDNKYYQENEGRMILYRLIDLFHVQGGFSNLVEYMSSQHFAPSCRDAVEFLECVLYAAAHLIAVPPTSESKLHSLLESMGDTASSLVSSACLNGPSSIFSYVVKGISESPVPATCDFSLNFCERQKDIIFFANAVFAFLKTNSYRLETENYSLNTLHHLLNGVSIILFRSSQCDIEDYMNFVQDLALQAISSARLDLKDFGLRLVSRMTARAKELRPPPRRVVVSKAGCDAANGVYTFKSKIPEICCVLFEKSVPNNSREGTGSEQSWLFSARGDDGDNDRRRWAITSEANGSSDILYVANSEHHIQPPVQGWRHATNSSKGTLPSLSCVGFAPSSTGEETNTLEHQLVKWAHDNRIIELFYSESKSAEFATWLVDMSSLINLMSFMNKRCDKENLLTDYRLAPKHLMPAWNRLVKSDDEQESSNFSKFLALVFPYLPDEVALPLLRAMRACVATNCDKVESVVVDIVNTSDQESRFLALSGMVRAETKKLMWNLRTVRIGCTTSAIQSKIWMKWEILDPRKQDPSRFNDFLDSESTVKDKEVPRKPKVSILDSKSRLVEVSLPIESVSGEYYVGAFVRASCDNYENGETMLLAIIATSDIEECLNDDEDRVNVQLCLPEDGLWSIEWCGVLRRDEPLATPRSALTLVDLTIRDKELMRRYREEVGAMDELARKQAGDIQSTVRKLRGSGSSKMTIESRYSLLNTALVSGRSTLNKLRRLVATYECECEEASVSGIVSLENALAEAQLPMAELEASLKSRNKKERIKGFKTHMTTLLQNGEVTSWLESVQQNDLDSLGGDSNRLYQLLVEAKGSQLNAAAIETASTRADLFSKKQIKTLATLWEEIRRVHTSHAGEANEAPSESFATEEQVPLKNQNAMQSPIATTVALSTVTPYSCSKESLRIGASHPSTESSLLAFLKENADCLKGSPDAFHHWLVDSEDIASLNDLADAVADDQYLQDVLHCNGLKGFKRSVFQKAVLVATGRCHNVERQQNKENEQPLSKLMCPLSGVLMTDRPVIAADGYTYELAAIAEWFENQNQEVEAAKKLIAAGNKSVKLLSIVDGGIVSPVTRTKMDSLALAPNKTVQTMARDVAKANKRVPFGLSLK